eukprot:TRINITY_DN3874_c0_g1_i2.p3 TRINITY_DN3874_c0_g1~~TRINITY_DN3874_c0_g1_i2.p3  ORF type:complete len:179 (-),score=14.78 TRINITY_DN3874_c0_g1_i2:174-710(-)
MENSYPTDHTDVEMGGMSMVSSRGQQEDSTIIRQEVHASIYPIRSSTPIEGLAVSQDGTNLTGSPITNVPVSYTGVPVSQDGTNLAVSLGQHQFLGIPVSQHRTNSTSATSPVSQDRFARENVPRTTRVNEDHTQNDPEQPSSSQETCTYEGNLQQCVVCAIFCFVAIFALVAVIVLL